jgi:chromosome segregation ATPase
MARDLTVLQRRVEEFAAKQEHLAAAQEQLAAKQEQMAQNIAKPQAVKRNIKHKMSSPPRRNAPPEPGAQALSVPRPAPNSRPPLPLPPDRR